MTEYPGVYMTATPSENSNITTIEGSTYAELITQVADHARKQAWDKGDAGLMELATVLHKVVNGND
jgi:hypothetical protein